MLTDDNTEVSTEVVENNTPAPEGTTTSTEAPAAAAPATEGKPAAEGGVQNPTSGEPNGEAGDENLTPEEKAAKAASYKPNMKFRSSVYNKETKSLDKVDHEIDPLFAPIMKDAESAELVRKLHEKANGIDSIRDRLVEERTRNVEVTRSKEAIEHQIADVRSTYQKAVNSGNILKLDTFFKKLEIPKEVIFEYAIQHAKLLEMEEAPRKAILDQIQAEERADELQQQQQALMQDNQTLLSEQHAQAMNFVLTRPEISALAQAFDARLGKEGAFAEQAWREGNIAYQLDKKVLTPEQAVQAVIARYALNTKPLLPPAPTQTGNPAAPASAPAASAASAPNQGKKVVQKANNTIPNIGSGSASPANGKQGPRSVEDIQKIYKEKYGS